LNAAGRQLDEEQNEKALESLSGPNLNREEVGCDDQVPVLSEKLFPRGLSNPLGSRLNTVTLQNVRNRSARQLMTQIRECTLDSNLTPIPVFLCHAHNQGFNIFPHGRSAGAAPGAAVVLAGD